MFDPPQTMSLQPEINHPENIDLEFPEGQVEQDTGSSVPHQEGIIEQEYNRPKEKAYKDSPELKRQVKISNITHKLLPKQLIERKILKGTHLPMSLREIKAGYSTGSHFKNIYLYLV